MVLNARGRKTKVFGYSKQLPKKLSEAERTSDFGEFEVQPLCALEIEDECEASEELSRRINQQNNRFVSHLEGDGVRASDGVTCPICYNVTTNGAGHSRR